MKHLQQIFGVFWLLLSCSVIRAETPADGVTAKRLNVLFLFTDDQRADTIGALGNSTIKTPNLDRLARSGFVFENAYCMGSFCPAVCLPSRHMMLSGKTLYHYDPKQKENTFGDVMRKSGYATFHCSKFGNTAHEYHKAFEVNGYLGDDEAIRTSGEHGRTMVDRAIHYLDSTWDRKRPFFMYLGFSGPHDPRVASQRWMNLYQRDEIPLPANYRPFHAFNNGELLIRDETLAPWPRTKKVVRQHLHDYYGCISSLDFQIGRLLKNLEESGQLENTLIVFSSDHGLAIGSHGLFGKQNVYEHSMKAPLILCGPGIPQGKTQAFAYLLDIFPTVCNLVGVNAPEGLDGRSQASVIHGRATSVRDTIFTAYMKVQRAVRHANWKLIRYPQINRTQLFNLETDPDELHDLSAATDYAEKVEQLKALLVQQQKLVGDTLPLEVAEPAPAEIDLSFFSQ